MGDLHTTGNNTAIAACSLPLNGTYTVVACDRGDRYTLGSNTGLKSCSKVMNPVTQAIKTPCDGGSSSILGSDTVIASTCPVGSILDMKYECAPCGDNKSTSKVGSEVCDVCKEGFYMKATGVGDADSFSCVRCGEGAKCSGLVGVPEAAPGYIATASDAYQMLKCFPSESCDGGSCSVGYGGSSCSMCYSGTVTGDRYYRSNSHCVKCPEMSVFALVPIYLVSALGVFGVLGFVVKASRVPPRLVMMLVTYLQVVASVKSLGLKWSPSTENVLQATTPLNFNVQSIAPECDMSVDYESRWLSGQMFPVVLLCVVGLVKVMSGVLSVGIEKTLSHTKWKVRSDDVRMSAKGFISISLKVLLLLYLSLLSSTLSVFDCVGRGEGSKSVLVAEPSIVCDVSEDPRYGRLRGLSILFIVLYVVGIPLVVLFLLLWSRRPGPESGVKKLVGESVHFLVEPYKPEYFYWKLVEMLRKVLMVFLPRLISSEYPELQGGVLISLFGAFILHNYFACPYAVGDRGGDFYNAAELVYSVCVMVIIMSGISLNTAIEKSVGSFGVVFTVLALVFLFGGVLFMMAVGYKYRLNKATTVAVDGLLAKGGGDSNDVDGGAGSLGGGSPSKKTVVSVNPVSSVDGKVSRGRVAGGVECVSGDGVSPLGSSSDGGRSDVTAAEIKRLQTQLQLMTEEKERYKCQVDEEREKVDIMKESFSIRLDEELAKERRAQAAHVAALQRQVEELQSKLIAR